MSVAVEDLRYPVGRFDPATVATGMEAREQQIAILAGLPDALRGAIRGLNDEQLDAPYRDGGWTVRQTVHHVADSHMNMYVRVKLALTEDWPTIVAYDEAAWAEMEDSRTMPVQVSLGLLAGMHARLTVVFNSIAEHDWAGRGFVHPERGRMSLATNLALYAWHSRHHTAHITALRARMGW